MAKDSLVIAEAPIPGLPPNRPAPPLEEYVQAHREAALMAISRGRKPDEDTSFRVDRAEVYARWRWKSYVDGHTQSL